VAASLLAGSAMAAGSGADKRYFDVVDSNHNGRISLSEYQDRFTYAFKRMDADHNDVLDPKEQLVPHGRKVTLQELLDRLEKQFKRQDKDGDGTLLPAEFLAPPA
jgi:Ca2+-binding EF-hand superfamily protein